MEKYVPTWPLSSFVTLDHFTLCLSFLVCSMREIAQKNFYGAFQIKNSKFYDLKL